MNKKHTLKKHEIHKLEKLKRHKYHHIVRKIHKKHRISYKTLFYMKEYGPRTHVASVIVKESIKMIILASIISSLGGVHLRSINEHILTILPLLILLPALASLIGSFGTIMSSKFTTMLYMNKIEKKWWKSNDLHSLVSTLLMIALITSFYIGILSYAVAYIRGFAFTSIAFLKIIGISLIATMSLVGIIIIISIVGGLWIFKKQEDPNNFLIPITTSVADFGSLLLFSTMVALLF